jgi:hypothetical protein
MQDSEALTGALYEEVQRGSQPFWQAPGGRERRPLKRPLASEVALALQQAAADVESYANACDDAKCSSDHLSSVLDQKKQAERALAKVKAHNGKLREEVTVLAKALQVSLLCTLSRASAQIKRRLFVLNKRPTLWSALSLQEKHKLLAEALRDRLEKLLIKEGMEYVMPYRVSEWKPDSECTPCSGPFPCAGTHLEWVSFPVSSLL